jgi:hypothetical protein
MLTFIYNPASNDDRLSCSFVCSRDIFDETTVGTIACRLKHLLNQLFSMNAIFSQIDTCLMPIIKLNLILSEETEEMKSIVFCRQSNVVNEGMSICLSTKVLDV